MSPLLTTTQIAHWLDVSERTIARMVKGRVLPRPVQAGKRRCFSADIVLPYILRDDDLEFSGGVTLKTLHGPIYFEVITAKYQLKIFDKQWALFEDLDERLHLRDWRTAFIVLPDHFHHCPIILSCEDKEVSEFPLRELHSEVFTAPDGFFERLAHEGFYDRLAVNNITGSAPDLKWAASE